jgi:hypothetical protein
MSTSFFILVIAAIGALYMVFFRRMKNRAESRRRGGENPVKYWLKGDEDDGPEDR